MEFNSAFKGLKNKLVPLCAGFLVWKLEGKRPLGRLRRRWEDNITMVLLEVGCGGMDGIELAQDRGSSRALVAVVRNFWVL